MNWYCFECMGMCVRIGKWKWVMPRRRRRCKQHGNALHVWPSRSHQSNWKPYFFPIFLLRFKLAVCLRHVRKVSGHVLWKCFLTSRYVVLKTFRRKTHQLLLFLFWGVSRRRSWLRCRRPRICCWFLRCVFCWFCWLWLWRFWRLHGEKRIGIHSMVSCVTVKQRRRSGISRFLLENTQITINSTKNRRPQIRA